MNTKYSKLFKFIYKLLISLVGLAVITCTILLVYPSLLINKNTLFITANLMKSCKVDKDNDSNNISIESETLFKKSIDIDLRNIECQNLNGLSFKFNEASLKSEIDLSIYSPVFKSIGPINISNGLINLNQNNRNDSNSSKSSQITEFFSFLSTTEIKPIKIENIKFVQKSKNGEMQSAVFDVSSRFSKTNQLIANAKIDSISGFGISKASAEVFVTHKNKREIKSSSATLKFTLNDGSKLAFVLDYIEGSNKEKQMSGNASYRNTEKEVQINWKGNLEKDLISLSLYGTARNLTKGINLIKINNCSISTKIDSNPKIYQSNLDLCNIDIIRNTFLEESKLPISFPTNIKTELTGNFNFNQESLYYLDTGKLNIDIKPIFLRHIKLTGNTQIDIKSASSSKTKPDIKISTDSLIQIDRFEDIVKDFKNTRFAIPAPFNTLSGSVKCKIKGKIFFEKESIQIPHNCLSKLSGPKQKIYIDLIGNAKIISKKTGVSPYITSELLLKNIELYLPSLSLTDPIPNIKGDSRFSKYRTNKGMKKNKNKPKPNNLEYKIRIFTKNEPVKIHFQELNAMIPIYFDLNLDSSSPPEGNMRTEKFSLEVINKKAFVDFIKLNLRKNKPTEIEARATIHKSRSDIILDIFGTITEPQWRVSSDPPQPDSQVMAELLYGGNYETLSGSQKSSITETQAAIADGALTLTSMFYLASTPIESVGYNPYTKQFHAEVKLKDDLSLSVGASTERENIIGISKRLFGNWSFETTAITQDPDSPNRGIAMLRWTKRY